MTSWEPPTELCSNSHEWKEPGAAYITKAGRWQCRQCVYEQKSRIELRKKAVKKRVQAIRISYNGTFFNDPKDKK